jgi:hypothetical protein
MNLMKSLAVSVFAAEGADALEFEVELELFVAVLIADAREFMELIVQPFGRGSRVNAKL